MLSIFQTAENDQKSKTRHLTTVPGVAYVNTNDGPVSPKQPTKHKKAAKRGVRLSTHYIHTRR